MFVCSFVWVFVFCFRRTNTNRFLRLKKGERREREMNFLQLRLFFFSFRRSLFLFSLSFSSLSLSLSPAMGPRSVREPRARRRGSGARIFLAACVVLRSERGKQTTNEREASISAKRGGGETLRRQKLAPQPPPPPPLNQPTASISPSHKPSRAHVHRAQQQQNPQTHSRAPRPKTEPPS